MGYCGFSVHGVTDTQFDLQNVADSADRALQLRSYAYEQARLTSMVGGNALRVFYSNSRLCSSISPIPLDLALIPIALYEGPWHFLQRAEKVKCIEGIAAVIRKIADALLVMEKSGTGLCIADLDSYLDGIRHFNAAQPDPAARVRVLLTNVTLVL